MPDNVKTPAMKSAASQLPKKGGTSEFHISVPAPRRPIPSRECAFPQTTQAGLEWSWWAGTKVVMPLNCIDSTVGVPLSVAGFLVREESCRELESLRKLAVFSPARFERGIPAAACSLRRVDLPQKRFSSLNRALQGYPGFQGTQEGT